MTEPAIYQASNQNTSLRQGEILTDVTQYNVKQMAPSPDQPDIISLSTEPIIHPYAIVVTQNCDLDWDYKARIDQNHINPSKLLNSVILCEVHTANKVKTDNPSRKEWELISSQRHERYYFFQKISIDFELQQMGLPELTADFKKVFAIDAAILYYQLNNSMALRRAILCTPYLEHFSSRYYYFHGRVALPAPHESDKSDQRATPDDSRAMPDPKVMSDPKVISDDSRAMLDESELISPDPRTRPPAAKAMPDESELIPSIDDELKR